MTDAEPRPSEVQQPRRRKRLWLAVLLLFLCYAIYVGRIFALPAAVEISPETTFVTEPLRDDGSVDFPAALHAEWSQGITSNNNAAVLLTQAFGPAFLPADTRDAYYEALGSVALPAEGHYLVPLDDFLDQSRVEQDRKWKIDEVKSSVDAKTAVESNPEIFDWVKHNDEPLELVVAATRRDRFFAPVVPLSSRMLLTAPLEILLRCRDAALLLRLRALLRLESHDATGACEDTLACYRLARLVSQHPALLGSMVAFDIDRSADSASVAIALSGQLAPSEARQFRNEFAALPQFASITKILDRGERLFCLDTIVHALQESDGPAGEAVPFGMSNVLDPNVVRREANNYFDRAVAAMHLKKTADRTAGLSSLTEDLKSAARSQVNSGAALRGVCLGDRAAVTRPLSKKLASFMFPAVASIPAAEDRARMQATLTGLGWALAEFRAVEGDFPETLDRLRPTYVDDVPRDFYADGAPIYHRVDAGFILYSVGPNGHDDAGLRVEECDFYSSDCDDIRCGITPVIDVPKDSNSLDDSKDLLSEPLPK